MQANGDAISQGQMFPMSYGMPTSSPLSAQLPEQGALHVGGIPRVASLDLLRQLMGTPGAAPQMKSSLAVKEGIVCPMTASFGCCQEMHMGHRDRKQR